MPKKYSIIIPTYNHLEDCLRPCIESVIKNSSQDTIELIIVANGCTDGTREYVGELFKNPSLCLRYIEFKEPIGYTKATNVGLKIAEGEYIILLNNDVILLDWACNNNWINLLEDPFIKIPSCGISGTTLQYSQPADSNFLIFFCVMISRAAFNKLGYLDEIFSPGSGEDIDYCIKAVKAGYSIHEVPLGEKSVLNYEEGISISSYPIYHQAEATVHGLSNWGEIFSRNMNILKERYNK